MDKSSEGSTLYTQNSNIKNTKNCNFLPETVPNSDRNGNLNSDQSNVESSVKLVKNHTEAFSDSDSGSDKPFSFIVSSKDDSNGTKNNQNMDSDSNDNTTVFKSKTNKLRILNISSDEDNTPETNGKPKFTHTSDSSDSDHDDDNTEISKYQQKSRIKNISSSDEDSQPSSTEHTDNIERSALKNCEQQARMKNRRNNIENKFKNLLSSRGKKSNVSLDEKTSVENTTVQNGKDDFSNDSSDGSEDLEMKTIKQKIKDRNESLKSTLYDPDTSDEDGNPRRNISQMVQKSSKPKQKRNNNSNSDGSGDEEISKIKQKIKERNKTLKTTICDPDTSDEEEGHRQKTPNAKSVRKSTKMISPQPMRMSAKQAMENMQKIKSESNRMLREKKVSLPYHRPKALSLKDIMSRRKPALSSDGKALPIKMNDEQLRQYAQQLEQRQKEMMELCKSDTEDEETPENDPKPNVDVSTDVADDKSPIEVVENCNEYDNDISFDEVNLNLKDKHKPEESNTKNDPSEIEEIKNDLELNDVANKDVLNNESSTTVNENENDTNTLNIEEFCLEESNTKNDPSEIEDIKNDLELNDVTNKDVLNNEPSTTENENKIIENDTNTLNTDESCHGQETLDVQNCRNEETISKISDMVIDAVASNTELDSQLISLNYDSEKLESNNEIVKKTTKNLEKEAITVGEETNICIENENENNSNEINSGVNKYLFEDDNDLFDNDDIDMEDIDRLIENAEIINTTNGQAVNSPMLVREPPNLNSKPKLAGAPGMVIDLDGTDAAQPKKLSGVELLKERFSYFATLKTPEEIERIREKKIKPGTQHSKLKQELEEQMAEQRSLEWAKRLEDDKQQRQELSALRGDQSEEDDIEKIEAKLAETEADIEGDESSSESEEEEPEENDVIIKDKPAAKNSLICDEAEESDCDEETGNISATDEKSEENDEGVENDDDSDEEPSSEESSEDENENDDDKPKKSRILKAFEDSDEEDAAKVTNDEAMSVCNEKNDNEKDKNLDNVTNTATQITQDDEIPSAQLQKSFSEDLFASQDNDVQLTSSIEKPNKSQVKTIQAQQKNEEKMSDGNNLAVISETQPYDDAKFDDIVGMCSGSFSQNIVNTQPQATQPMQTQELGDDVLALCTGKFYDNDFITQENDAQTEVGNQPTGTQEKEFTEKGQSITIEESSKDDSKKSDDRNLLRSIIDELDGPEFNEPKPNKFFNGNNNKEVQHNTVNHQKKRFVIDSDEEEKDPTQDVRKKKQKKKKLQDRALQISDDEEEESEDENEYENMSEPEEEAERVVEYDSEENEVEVQQPVQNKKKKRKVTEFFENEAELTSEDEYVGSGDEDERGLDRMEREEGDDDTFHQGRLQAELGQIHMRDVLDQDKREVRLIQELLFEDGDLGDGHRQRKFRWRNADGVEEIGAGLDEFGDTQEEEFESEEQWRKQRHEREVFLRTLMQNETGESDTSLNVSVSRTSIIKANLTSKTMSSLLMEVSSTEEKSSVEKDKVSTDKEKSDSPLMLEKRSSKDIPSPVKKPFSMMQQNYRGSILSRGSGALARLAALATPLAGDHNDNAPKMGSLAPGKRNFVFAAVSPKTEDKPKVSKRKGDSNAGTPQLMKKMKTDEKQGLVKTSLLDHLRV